MTWIQRTRRWLLATLTSGVAVGVLAAGAGTWMESRGLVVDSSAEAIAASLPAAQAESEIAGVRVALR